MELVIDIGNTKTKLAIFNGSEIIAFKTISEPSLNEVEVFVEGRKEVSSAILSSVTDYPGNLPEYLRSNFTFLELDEHTPVPITNRYLTPETLGQDRLAAAVAGASLFPNQPVLVINAGTCIIYDFVDASGQYLGGAISPGMEMRFRALNTFTGKLPLITPKEIDHITGRNTEESILSGVVFGMTGEMEAVIQQYSLLYPGLKVILSGGDLNNFDKRLKINIFAVPNIVIHGLHKILEFNVTKSP
jgi:type III pantothenate kinase